MRVTRIESRSDEGRHELIVELDGTHYESISWTPGTPHDVLAERLRWLAQRLEYRGKWTPEMLRATARR